MASYSALEAKKRRHSLHNTTSVSTAFESWTDPKPTTKKRAQSAKSNRSLLDSLKLSRELIAPQTASNLDNRSRRREQELLEHLKLQCKKYKNKYEVMLREKNQSDDRSRRESIQCEEWKTKCKSTELEHKHFMVTVKNQTKEKDMSHHRELGRVQLMTTNQVHEMQNKMDSQQHYMKRLKQINAELTAKNEDLSSKCSESKAYQSSLENKLESSMKRAMEVQDSLTRRLSVTQSDVHQNEQKHSNEVDRITHLMSIKESDIKFLRANLNNERDANQKKMADRDRAHSEHVQRLQKEVASLSKELQSMERQRGDFARSSQIASDSLNKALSEYTTERESLGRIHLNELERKSKALQEMKETVGRQQERLHLLMSHKKESTVEIGRLRRQIGALKHEMSRNNGDSQRLTEELKTVSGNEKAMKQKQQRTDRVLESVRTKYKNTVTDLSAVTTQRDELRVSVNKMKLALSESEMERNQFMVRSETAMEMNEALKVELENQRRNSISVHKYQESSQKAHTLSQELGDCYTKIERLSLSLDSTRGDLNALQSQSVPLTAYEALSGNINKMEAENLRLNKKMNGLSEINDNLRDDVNEMRLALKSHKMTQRMLEDQKNAFKESIHDLTATNREVNQQRNHLKKKYKKIKNNLDELSKMTGINQDLIRSNKFLRAELGKLVNQTPKTLSRECANKKCNHQKGTYLKIHPKTLNALKKACNF